MNARPLGIFWPRRGEQIYILGRRLERYEHTDSWILDPDSLFSEDGAVIGRSASLSQIDKGGVA